MKIDVRTHHVDITPALKDYASKKMAKLEKFFEKIVDITIELNILETSEENKRQLVSVTIKVPGNILHAKEASKDMYASIDMVYDKLDKQLKKFKSKMKDYKKDGNKRTIPDQPATISTNVISPAAQKLYKPKPMSAEDAARYLMDNPGQPFLMFRNIRTEEINVIYQDKDNSFALLEP